MSEWRQGVKSRIALWAIAGALVVVFWAIYIHATYTNPLGRGGVGRALICITCPIALAGRHPMTFYVVLMVNAATYAVVGALVESARRYGRAKALTL
jgi:uncharacterized BrkB/YihY/UPF0761 family membrane protein